GDVQLQVRGALDEGGQLGGVEEAVLVDVEPLELLLAQADLLARQRLRRLLALGRSVALQQLLRQGVALVVRLERQERAVRLAVAHRSGGVEDDRERAVLLAGRGGLAEQLGDGDHLVVVEVLAEQALRRRRQLLRRQPTVLVDVQQAEEGVVDALRLAALVGAHQPAVGRWGLRAPWLRRPPPPLRTRKAPPPALR